MLTLTSQEITELTDRSQPAAQIRWLKDRNWIFEIGGDGSPKVARAYFERKMVFIEDPVLDQSTIATKTHEWSVNKDAFRQKFIQ